MRIPDVLFDPVWWGTVVAGTILLHIVAIRVDRALDRTESALARLIRSWRAKSRAKHAALVEEIRQSPERLAAVRHLELRAWIRAGIDLTVGLLSAVLINTAADDVLLRTWAAIGMAVFATSGVARLTSAYRYETALNSAEGRY